MASNDTPPSNDAVQALLNFSREYPNELTIVAIGPATNIALAIALDARFVENVKEVIYMGCTSTGRGNTTPHAEFNVACDPEAAHIMLTAFVGKLTVVSWETVCDHGLPWSFFDTLCQQETKTAAFLKRICSAYEANCRPCATTTSQEHKDPNTFILCDAYASAILVHKYIDEASVRHLVTSSITCVYL